MLLFRGATNLLRVASELSKILFNEKLRVFDSVCIIPNEGRRFVPVNSPSSTHLVLDGLFVRFLCSLHDSNKTEVFHEGDRDNILRQFFNNFYSQLNLGGLVSIIRALNPENLLVPNLNEAFKNFNYKRGIGVRSLAHLISFTAICELTTNIFSSNFRDERCLSNKDFVRLLKWVLNADLSTFNERTIRVILPRITTLIDLSLILEFSDKDKDEIYKSIRRFVNNLCRVISSQLNKHKISLTSVYYSYVGSRLYWLGEVIEQNALLKHCGKKSMHLVREWISDYIEYIGNRINFASPKFPWWESFFAAASLALLKSVGMSVGRINERFIKDLLNYMISEEFFVMLYGRLNIGGRAGVNICGNRGLFLHPIVPWLLFNVSCSERR